jgi:hypothetical protein
LGNSGLYISKIVLGTAGFGSSKWQEWVLEDEEALPLLKYAFDCGINTWDTVSSIFFSLPSPISLNLRRWHEKQKTEKFM